MEILLYCCGNDKIVGLCEESLKPRSCLGIETEESMQRRKIVKEKFKARRFVRGKDKENHIELVYLYNTLRCLVGVTDTSSLSVD